MRWLLVMVVLGASGCGRWSGRDAARRELVRERFLDKQFPLSSAEVSSRIGARSRCTWNAENHLSCGGCFGANCFEVIEQPEGTRVITPAPLTEPQYLELWRAIDAPSLAQFRAELPPLIDERLSEQARAFEPRLGLTAGLLGTGYLTTGSLSIDARVGVRRWFAVDWIGHLALEYHYRGSHSIGLRIGVEVARWVDGRLWGVLGVPPASLAFFTGPSLNTSLLAPGMRTGVGLHFTDWPMAPLIIEVVVQTTFAGQRSMLEPGLSVGLGW
jgi:hypothetical protein